MSHKNLTIRPLTSLGADAKWTEFPSHTVYDTSARVTFIPFLSEDGRVGYRCIEIDPADGRETFIYFNPSESDGPGDANVFVYYGGENDPNEDAPEHFYNIDFESSFVTDNDPED